MDDKVFQTLREFIYRESGINLTNEKRALLSNRLFKRLRALKLKDEHEYLEYLKADREQKEIVKLIDVISTNFTSFYRESDHFSVFAQLCKRWSTKKQKDIRIWCAASSSGEEPYTIAITAKEALNGTSSNFRVLATDICIDVLETAVAGRYEDRQVAKVPAELKRKYFAKTKDKKDDRPWQVVPGLAETVIFRRMNLSRFPYPLRGDLDVIFCRNVMIYFDLTLRSKVVAEFYRLLRPGGFLFVSHCENLLGIEHSFKSYASSVYQKV